MNDQDKTRVIRRSTSSESEPTRLLSQPGGRSDVDSQENDVGTRIFRPKGSQQADVLSKASLEEKNPGGFFKDPVVGWLVIVGGPGKGCSFELGYGMNSIGRGEDVRVRVDFGDSEISREPHAMVTFDRKNQRYYLQHGGGANLTSLGQAPVLSPTEITGMERISLGKTELVFVPLCVGAFDWDNV